MKDMGERFGSGAWAVPVVVTSDTVYVHTDIEKVEEQNGEPVDDLYKYHEIQYGLQEYIEVIGKENENLNSQLSDTQLALCDVYELIEGLGV